MKQRLTWVVLGFFGFAGLLVMRAAQLQILPHARLTELSRRQFQAQMTLKPKRGSIVDRNGEILAFSVETKSLAANPQKIREKKTFARRWAHTLGLSVDELSKRLQSNKSFVWIHRHLSEELVSRLHELRQSDVLEGLMIVPESRRIYPFGDVAASLLGTVSIDNEGQEGVELWQNQKLRGKEVQVQIQRDALGRTAWIDTLRTRQLKQGEDIPLTLDLALQFAVENELKASMRSTGAQSGTVLVMNALSGEMLAIANAPSFDPNERVRGGTIAFDARRNRALTDGFEPGSVVKPLVLAAAFKKGKTLQDRVWGGMGELKLQGRVIREAESHERFGWMSLKRMIQVSSNVGTAKLALELGPEAIRQQFVDFGLSQRSGIGLPGELSGWIPTLKEMKPLTLANVAFGQGLFVTPIQLLRSYAALANGGWLITPKLMTQGQAESPPLRVISEQDAASIRHALRAVVEPEGTGMKASVEGYRIAGKTGTAQIFDAKAKRYSASRYVSSFIGFADDIQPQLVVLAMLTAPKGVYYASETAAPLFARVMQEVASRYLIQSPKAPAAAPLAQVSRPKAVQDEIQISAAAPRTITLDPALSTWPMPDLKGLTAREVLKAFEGHPFSIELKGFGIVKNQQPKPGAVIAEGERIQVELAQD